MTAKQLFRFVGINWKHCSVVMRELKRDGYLKCLTPQCRRSRIYWLTPLGQKTRQAIERAKVCPRSLMDFPVVNWELYSWVCYNHRRTVLLALSEPLQPAAIKRRLRKLSPHVPISHSNVRDIVRFFRQKGIVEPVKVGKEYHWRYRLTELGFQLRILLTNVIAMNF